MSFIPNCLSVPGRAVLWLLFGLWCTSLAATEAPLFSSDETLSVTISAPLEALTSDRSDEPEYREAQLQYTDAAGAIQQLDIGIRPRGKTRRNPKTCRFPPLRLNFKTKAAAGTIFAGQDKLKLVTHCQNGRKMNQQYVLQEYLIYRALNLFTEQSFKTRLLSVNYQSTDGDGKSFTSYAFIIESNKQMAARNGKEFRKPESIVPQELDEQAANTIEVFQYLIGNTDWSMLDGPGETRCCHNTILISPAAGPYVPVPYDFDYSGIINTPYAVPGPSTGLDTVRKRAYRGLCQLQGSLDSTLASFRDKRAAIYALFLEQPGLSKNVVKKTKFYLDSFFKTVDDPRRVQRQIINKCR